jgi:hypothetical protein
MNKCPARGLLGVFGDAAICWIAVSGSITVAPAPAPALLSLPLPLPLPFFLSLHHPYPCFSPCPSPRSSPCPCPCTCTSLALATTPTSPLYFWPPCSKSILFSLPLPRLLGLRRLRALVIPPNPSLHAVSQASFSCLVFFALIFILHFHASQFVSCPQNAQEQQERQAAIDGSGDCQG